MSDLMICKGIVDCIGFRGAQKDMCASQQSDRPRKAPAVAMKQRQSPQIHGMMRHLPGDHVIHRVGPCTTM